MRSAPLPSTRRPFPACVPFLVFAVLVAGVLACREPPPEPPPPAEVPVRAEAVTAAEFQPSIVLLGRVEPAGRHVLRPEQAGRIRYPPRFAGGLATGARVARGEALFAVDAPEVDLALAEAEIRHEAATADLDRVRRGVEGGFRPSADLELAELEARLAADRLANAREVRRRLETTAPAAGVLRVATPLPPGSPVTPADGLAELALDGAARVEAWASAADLVHLELGLAAEVLVAETSLARGERRAGAGRLTERAAELGADGLARVVVKVAEDAGLPLAGEGVEVRIRLAPRPGALTVPERALVVQNGIASIFVLEPEGSSYRARSHLVLPGGRAAGRLEILDGLAAGDLVAVEGAELLADGVRAVIAEAPAKAPGTAP